MRAPGALVMANLKQNKHACARILIRRVKVGDEAGRGLWPGLALTEPRAPRSGVANPG